MHILLLTYRQVRPNTIITILTHLLRLGANPNLKSNYGRTPLHILMSRPLYGNDQFLDMIITVINLLVEYGANLNEQDKRGQTVFHYLIHRLCNDNGIETTTVIDKLMEWDTINPNIVDDSGLTAVQMLFYDKPIFLPLLQKSLSCRTGNDDRKMVVEADETNDELGTSKRDDGNGG